MPRHIEPVKVFFAKTEPPGKKETRVISFRTEKSRNGFVQRFTNCGGRAEKLTSAEARSLAGKLLQDGDQRTRDPKGGFISHAHYDV